MIKTEFRDLLVLLPGICGSVLCTKSGDPLWKPSLGVAWNFLTRSATMLDTLRLEGDDADREALDDGVRAVELVQDVHLIPGLWKIDGYSGFRQMIADAFDVEPATAAEDDRRVANYYEFPYDWRRDNRASARRLERFIVERLNRWRKGTPFRDARVILVAHSMGGLVARYYLEALGGWQDCRALITFGTPFRGSVKAADFLANGHRLVPSRFTDLVRSLTSVYQLLPRYRVIEEQGSYKRIAETEDALPGISRERALGALRFHEEIDAAADSRAESGYELVPFVGTSQPTLQSARLVDGKLRVDVRPPNWTTFPPGEGDGTVPRVSAVPVHLSSQWLNTFVAERHATLQNNGHVLQDLQDRLIQSQVGTEHIRGEVAGARKPALAMDLDDLYSTTEPITVRCAIREMDPGEIKEVRARVVTATTEAVAYDDSFVSRGDEWLVTVPPLPAGAYRIEVSASAAGHLDPVHDVFEVATGSGA